MSDNWLQYVPADPRFQPTAEAAAAAQELLSDFLPDAEQVRAEFKDDVEFFHPGENWSGVKCPACGTDAETWWNDAMDEASARDFGSLLIKAYCCGARVSLNDLDYGWPAAFGKFVLEAMNPHIRELAAEQEARLARVLGCELRRIWVRL